MSGGTLLSTYMGLDHTSGSFAPLSITIVAGTSSGDFKLQFNRTGGWAIRYHVQFNVINKASLSTNLFITA